LLVTLGHPAVRRTQMAPNRSIPEFEPFAATVVNYDHSPDECTIYPTDVDETAQATTWITAEESAFCPLQSRR